MNKIKIRDRKFERLVICLILGLNPWHKASSNFCDIVYRKKYRLFSALRFEVMAAVIRKEVLQQSFSKKVTDNKPFDVLMSSFQTGSTFCKNTNFTNNNSSKDINCESIVLKI
jgi:hypothetical protein